MRISWSEFGPLPNYERCLWFAIEKSFCGAIFLPSGDPVFIPHATGVICVHNTAMGPSLGGLRIRQYKNTAEMIADCARLSRGMSYKNAAAGLCIGGGKAVININPEKVTEELLLAYAKAVNFLHGLYITAPDMNTTPQMMDIIAKGTPYVTCLSEQNGGLGDPSPWTAKGVFLSLKAAVPFVFGTNNLEGFAILVQGYGKVGRALVKMCLSAKMKVMVLDTDEARRKMAYDEGCSVYDNFYPYMKFDVYSPNATGGVLTPATIPLFANHNVRLIVGGANNQLANEEQDIKLVQKHNILWVPDFVANAGGVAEACAEWEMKNCGQSRENTQKTLEERVQNIAKRVEEIIFMHRGRKITTLAAAQQLAERTVADRGGVLR